MQGYVGSIKVDGQAINTIEIDNEESTNAIEINNQEVLSEEEIIIYTAFATLVLATLFAAGKQMKKSKTDSFEFEVDVEKAVQSKKEIKKTLKNVMAKNNAKTTLIQ